MQKQLKDNFTQIQEVLEKLEEPSKFFVSFRNISIEKLSLMGKLKNELEEAMNHLEKERKDLLAWKP